MHVSGLSPETWAQSDHSQLSSTNLMNQTETDLTKPIDLRGFGGSEEEVGRKSQPNCNTKPRHNFRHFTIPANLHAQKTVRMRAYELVRKREWKWKPNYIPTDLFPTSPPPRHLSSTRL